MLKRVTMKNEKGENEEYLKSVGEDGKVSRACNLLMYLILNHHGEKSIMQDPKASEALVGEHSAQNVV